MTDLIDRIGPYLGIAAFLGLAILAFLIIQQAREVRRLREWAGRAPERAGEAAEAEAAVAEARGEEVEPAEVEEAPPGRLALWLHSVRDSIADRYAELDRRLPIDPRYVGALLVAVVIAAVVLTSGFGLIGGSDDSAGGGGGKHTGGKSKPEQGRGGGPQRDPGGRHGRHRDRGCPGSRRGDRNPGRGSAQGVQGRREGRRPGWLRRDHGDVRARLRGLGANELAKDVSRPARRARGGADDRRVRDRSGRAPLALVIGRDDADFGS